MGVNFSGDDELISDINITPFVDIILVVLIIFMVTATTIANSSIKVNLPDAATGDATENISLGLTLKASGELLLDGKPVSTQELKAAIATAMAEADEVVCLIAADRQVAHGRVVWLIDLVKAEGVARFALNIDRVTSIGADPATLGEGLGVDIQGGSP
jgi:biopolymer transport protein ExbD